MTYLNVLPSLHVADFDAVVDWYSNLFDRGPDRRPMDGDVEWQLTETGGLQIFRNPDAPVATTVILAVDDATAEVKKLAARGITTETFDVPSGAYRLAQIQDPAANTSSCRSPLSRPRKPRQDDHHGDSAGDEPEHDGV